MTFNPSRGSTEIIFAETPMTLMRNEQDGTILYEEEPIDYVQILRDSDDASHSSTLPDEAATFARTNFGRGIGSSIEEEPDVESGKINYGYPYDVNGRGEIISPPLVTTITLPVTMTTITGFFEMVVGGNVRLFMIGDRYCLVKNLGADTFIVSKDFTAGQIAKDAEVFQGTQASEYAFVSLGSTGAAQRYWIFDGAGAATLWTQHATDFADYFKKYRSELYRFRYVAGQGWTVALSSNGGTAATWGTEIQIGDGGAIGTGLEILDDVLYVAKSDGLFSVDVGTTPDDNDLLGGFIRNRRSPNNGINMFAWRDYLFYPTNDGGLWCRMIDGTVFEMGPTFILGSKSPIRGRITAITGDDHWLYAVVYNALKNESYLCKAKIDTFADGTNRPNFAWFGAIIVWTGGTLINAIHVSGVSGATAGTNPCLWAGRSDNRVDYIALPKNGVDPVLDVADGGGCRATTGVWYMPETTVGFPNYTKYWDSDLIETLNLASGIRFIDEEFSTDGGATWSTLGRFESDYQGPIDFNNIASRRLLRRYTMGTDSPTQFITVRSLDLTYIVRFPDKAKITFTVAAARHVGGIRGSSLSREDPEVIIGVIRAARASAGPVRLQSPYGTLYEVLVKYWKRVNLAAEAQKQYEWAAQVVCVVKSQTANLGLYDVSHYDSGVVYA